MIASRPVQEGANVFSTIDHTIQAQAEQVLRPDGAQWGAEGRDARSCSTRRPATVLAMAQTPGYNDERHLDDVRRPLLRNRAVTDTYEPGSTFKLVTITGALSEGLVTPATRFTLPYELQYGPC